MSDSIKYKNYVITYNPKPVPCRQFDYDFVHEDFDGAPDSEDIRCGTGESVVDCKDLINVKA